MEGVQEATRVGGTAQGLAIRESTIMVAFPAGPEGTARFRAAQGAEAHQAEAGLRGRGAAEGASGQGPAWRASTPPDLALAASLVVASCSAAPSRRARASENCSPTLT